MKPRPLTHDMTDRLTGLHDVSGYPSGSPSGAHDEAYGSLLAQLFDNVGLPLNLQIINDIYGLTRVQQ